MKPAPEPCNHEILFLVVLAHLCEGAPEKQALLDTSGDAPQVPELLLLGGRV